MMSGHDENLSEVVKITDIAVRTASQLRLLKAGKGLGDKDAIESAIKFLILARAGGTFITRKSSSLQRSLKPFSWATDTYMELHSTTKPDYERVASYIEWLVGALRSAVDEHHHADPAQLESVATFFGKLGNILGSKADKALFEVGDLPYRKL